MVVDAGGQLINCEEYTPYGETSFGSFGRKRYRFTGKERDEESSLYYYGARYYAPGLARWIGCDPAGLIDSLNLYSYVRQNPLRAVDSTGKQAEPATTQVTAEDERAGQSIVGGYTASQQPAANQVNSSTWVGDSHKCHLPQQLQ